MHFATFSAKHLLIKEQLNSAPIKFDVCKLSRDTIGFNDFLSFLSSPALETNNCITTPFNSRPRR